MWASHESVQKARCFHLGSWCSLVCTPSSSAFSFGCGKPLSMYKLRAWGLCGQCPWGSPILKLLTRNKFSLFENALSLKQSPESEKAGLAFSTSSSASGREGWKAASHVG